MDSERYGVGTEGFYNYIWDIHSTFPQLPIWITEYADISDNATGEQSLCDMSGDGTTE